MSRIAAIVALILILGGLFFFISKPTAPSAPALPKSVENNFEDWHLYNSPNNHFQVFFPSLPQNASSTLTDKVSKKPKTYNTYVSQKPDGTTFIINVITLPEGSDKVDEAVILNQFISELVEASKDNQLKDKREGEFHKQKAVDFLIGNKDVNVVGKAFKKGRELYILSVMTQGKEPDPAEFLFFLNSFQINEKQ